MTKNHFRLLFKSAALFTSESRALIFPTNTMVDGSVVL